ncbi:DExH-box ATP-dependent RNA helicase DExH3 [Cucumis melo var. makuwa]|uniref:RNA helicase n=2 Tax=Cucumis melo TaxID=3656 RepID=A0A5A7SUF3_CUCMM|nr:DExH-box ATP-dependent RNA helicase DExH3 [Cucumis melo]KAA0034620.1 DExH-box ATP-dependent RNA helicase DExH3 [Cucumis melo var. makuwa]TYK09171.1 DExH-box ATP-dependent RNA helicase DExH3 [Cucumis melo var. makuwa]
MHNFKRLPNFLLVLSKNISCDLSSNHGLAVRPLKLLLQQSRSYSVSRVWRCSYHYAAEQFSDDEYECDGENNTASSSVANIDEWKWKLSLLSRNEKDQEIVSRDNRDRRDFEQISNLAKKMGLYCSMYGKVVVASKVPLPNYRPDLDDKRPQREVVIPLSLQRRVEGLLQEHCDRIRLSSGKASEIPNDAKSIEEDKDVNMDEFEDSYLDGSVMEKVLQRRSLRMRNMQRAWQESPEGRKMLDFRRSLPAFKEKEKLLQAIAQNQVVVISGETGCGKTTQLPQYLLESEIETGRGAFCSIICTQPRRISAMAVSERVSIERGEPLGETVGYKVRLEGMKGKNTHLLFCTSGILLRRLLSDRNLNGVTHVFVDEIHERGMNEDFLLIVLKDLLPRRRDLRLILMSATLNAELFSSYFGGAPTIHIPGFTFPVRSYFLEDVLEMTGYKLTSFNQIDDYGQEKMWKTQKQLAPRKRKNQITSLVENALDKCTLGNYSSNTRDSLSSWMPDCIGFNLIEAVLCHICRKERPGAVLVFLTGWEDISSLRDQLRAHPLLGDPNRVLLLTCHGSMATSEQRLIFEKPAQNIRKVVLATNMAEASITINDVVFVIDCGKAKETTYDALNNTPCLLPSWISQASARQRRGRAGRVQPGKCYHLYPKCVFTAFSEYQLPELLRTPLNSLCLQIKSLQVPSVGEFLSSALQPPKPLAVQNAIDFLKMIGAFDEKENLTNLGKFLSMLPVDPKLGKMLIMGAIFHCFDPILTIVSGLSVRDPFLLPQDKKDLAGIAKGRFSAKDYSDHMALVRAYEGWKDAEREGSSYEYCWRNFLSMQTLQAIDSLRRQFSFILKDAGLVDLDGSTSNKLSHNQSLVRAIICSGLFPGVASVVHRETSMSFKTMDDGQVLLYANSVNARFNTIPFPWLVFGEKVKVNTVFLRDSTGISDSMLILFGGAVNRGVQAGHLKMLNGYVEFFMDSSLADCYLQLKEELDKLIENKLENPGLDILKEGKYLVLSVQELVSGDQCEGRFVFGRNSKKQAVSKDDRFTKDGTNPKSLLQTLLMRAGHSPPKYKTKHLKTNEFRALVEFKGMQFVGKPKKNKQLAERDAAIEALAWLTQTSDNNANSDDDSPIDVTDNMLKLLGKRRRSKRR